MHQRISFFGGITRGSVTRTNGQTETLEVFRDVWFDRDVDGRWLVWVTEHDGRPTNGAQDEPTGAIVVRNRDVSAFITLLGELIVAPAAFEHEPTFYGADGVAGASPL